MVERCTFIASFFALSVLATAQVPTEIQMPGTQPGEIVNLEAVQKCDNCHSAYNAAVEPWHNWAGSMMGQAARDPLFWASVAVAEQDFAGSGDLCLRCHTPTGWLAGRSTPTNGSALVAQDADAVSCDACHKFTDTDGSEILGVQNAPFVANDGGTPATGYYGSAMMSVYSGSDKLGPYADAASPHPSLASNFHRSAEFCGTCHDVSNPAVGDLAPNNGSLQPLAAGTFSGLLGTAVDTKAAFNNFPYAYGTVERTFSEHQASAFATMPVSAYGALPSELKAGAIEKAWSAAIASNPSGGGNYVDGDTRTFSCQTCHMPPVQGKGCNKTNAPVRMDLPLHDLTGGNYWMAEVIKLMDQQDELVLGGGLGANQIAALDAGAARARDSLDGAASLSITGNTLRIVNLTGHKLISGYPEGRRMWIRVVWRDQNQAVLRVDGAYGALTAMIDGIPTAVNTILDLGDPHTRIYEAHFGISQAWAHKLVNQLGAPALLPLSFDRVSGQVEMTLGDLAAAPPGAVHRTHHFVLNDTLAADNRIPPLGMSYDEALLRNVLPEPDTLFGNPGPGGVFDYHDQFELDPPAAAATADVELVYQPTSWEYIQFLYLANPGTDPFLGSTGADILDAWLATGMAEPHVMATATWEAPPVQCAETASATQYGPGKPGSNGIPQLVSLVPPVVGGTTDLTLTSGLPNAPVWLLFFGIEPAAVPFDGGTLLVSPLDVLIISAPLDGSGGITVPIALAANAGICGANLYFQIMVPNDPGAVGFYKTSQTSGLHWILGS